MNVTPRQRYLDARKGIAAKHQKMVDSEEFQSGADFAMFEYIDKMTTGADANNVNSAMARYFCVLGAKQYLQVFKTLADETPRIEVLQSANLNHSA